MKSLSLARTGSVFGILIALSTAAALVGCAGGSAEDIAAPSASDLSSASSSSSKLSFGQQSAAKKATGEAQKYTFDVEDGAAVEIDADEAFVPGESALVDPPKDVTLTGPGGAKVDAQSQTFPGGGQANAGVVLRASGLAKGTYTISYVGVVPHSYFIELKGHNGTGLNAPCDPTKGIRHNSVCGDSLRCDDSDSICAEPAKVGEFCDTEKNGDDVCTDGHVCKFDEATSHGDEGFNGRCR
jgi:hypothetical protein